jgi:hypothetical protein
MLDARLQYECLFHRGMMCPKSSLCWSVEVHRVGLCGQSMVHGSHENLREGWCDRDAPVIFWVCGVPFALVKGYNFSCTPGLGGFCCNCAGVKEVCETSYTSCTHKFQQVWWQYTVATALGCFKLFLQYKL